MIYFKIVMCSIIYGVLCMRLSRAAVMLDNADSGQPPSAPLQMPGTFNAPAIHVRVTSGRQGGRFFYRVSQMNVPDDAYTVVLPMNYLYRFLPYPLLMPIAPSISSTTSTAITE